MPKLSNLKIQGLRLNLLAASVVPLFLMSIVMMLVYAQIVKLAERLDSVLGNAVPAVTTSIEIRDRLNLSQARIWRALSLPESSEIAESNIADLEGDIEQISSLSDIYAGYDMPDRAKKLRESLLAGINGILPKIQTSVDIMRKNNAAELRKLEAEELTENFSNLREVLSNIELNNIDVLEKYRENVTRSAVIVMTIGGIIALVVSLAISFVVTSRLVSRFYAVSSQVENASERCRTQSQAIGKSADLVSTSTSQAAAALAQTSAAMNQINAMMIQCDQNALTSSKASQKSMSSVEKNKEGLITLRDSLNSIANNAGSFRAVVDSNNSELKEIIVLIQQIGEKANIINDIVFQTKLLSFNASVESARAGEHGRGFAVVAEEVGNLARVSGEAAQNIKSLLTASETRVVQIVEKTSDATKLMVSQNEDSLRAIGLQVEKNLGLLSEVASEFGTVDRLVQSISTAISEQSRGVKEVNLALTTIHESAEKNQAETHQIQETSLLGSKINKDLADAVSQLSEIIKGAA